MGKAGDLIGLRAAFVGILLILLLFLANAAISYWNTDRLVRNEAWVQHSQQVLEQLERIRATAARAEASQREYLLTGDDGHLAVFQDAVAETRSGIRGLVDATKDNASQQNAVRDIERIFETRLSRLRATIETRREQGLEAARAILEKGEGEALTVEMHARADAVADTERMLLEERTAESQRSFDMKVLTNLLGTLLGIAVTCLAFLFFLRTVRLRREAETAARAETKRQTALAELRQLALSDADLDELMSRTVRLVAEALDVPLAKVLELLPGGEKMVLRAGIGWSPGLVGQATVDTGLDSQAGYTLRASRPIVVGDLRTFRPIVVEDLATEDRFRGPPLLVEHGVVSGMSTIIHGQGETHFGVLGAHTKERRRFSDEEVSFFSAVAKVLASAIQRRAAEAALRASEARFRALAQSVPEIVWTSLPDGRCDYVNRRWEDFTGLPLERALDLGWVEALHEEDVERSRTRWMRSMETGEPFECEYRFRGADGSYRWCLGRALPLRDEQDRIVKWFGNCMDIDAHVRMEKALEETDRRKNDFLAMLAHELRNPLTPIAVVGELLRGPDLPPERIAQARRIIEDQVSHMTRLVDDLAEISRIGYGKLRLHRESVPVRQILDRALEMAGPAIEGRGHELEVDPVDPSLRVEVDLTRMAQVMCNLLTNAAKYMDRGGHIRVSAGREGESVVLRVRDRGIGIPADQLDAIFEDFYQVERSRTRSQGGLGIGLGLVRRLVELHGGSIRATSEGPDRGSEFVVRLPASREDPAEAPDAVPAGRDRPV